MDEVTIRPARREDVPAIVGLLADDDLGSQRERPLDPLPRGYLDAFDEIDGDPRQLLAVAVLDGDLIGTLQLTFLRYLTFGGGLRAQVEAVRIADAQRGTGLGATLLRWAIARARAEGAHVVQLTTDKRRPEAHRFYVSQGFQPTHEGMKLWLEAPGDRAPSPQVSGTRPTTAR